MSGILNTEGTFEVEIGEPHWEELPEKNGDANRMALVLPLETGTGDRTTYRIFFTSAIAASGRNKGKPLHQIGAEECIELGMSEPFAPHKIAELTGKIAEVVMQAEEYKGVTTVRPRFLNSRSKRVEPDKANAIWAKLTGKPVTAPPAASAAPSRSRKAAPAVESDPNADQVPF